MPSEEHELLAERLPGNHALLRLLLRDACGLELSTLSPLPGSEKVRNTNLPELRSDGVVLEVDGERVVSVTTFEPQLSKDEEKRLAWPCTMAGFRAQVQVPVRVVVVAPTRAVARWAARPIVLDDGGSVVTPIVIGPDQIPLPDIVDGRHPRNDTTAVPAAIGLDLGARRCPRTGWSNLLEGARDGRCCRLPTVDLDGALMTREAYADRRGRRSRLRRVSRTGAREVCREIAERARPDLVGCPAET